MKLNHGEYKLLNKIRYHMNYMPWPHEHKLIDQLINKGHIYKLENGSVQATIITSDKRDYH